jgi:hypothetical protein
VVSRLPVPIGRDGGWAWAEFAVRRSLRLADGATIARGTDFAVVADGRLAQVAGFPNQVPGAARPDVSLPLVSAGQGTLSTQDSLLLGAELNQCVRKATILQYPMVPDSARNLAEFDPRLEGATSIRK